MATLETPSDQGRGNIYSRGDMVEGGRGRGGEGEKPDGKLRHVIPSRLMRRDERGENPGSVARISPGTKVPDPSGGSIRGPRMNQG